MNDSRLCPACGSSTGHLIGEFLVTHVGPLSRPTFNLVNCACSLVYLSPLPTEEDFAELYQRSSQFDAPEYVDNDKVIKVLRYMMERLEFLLEGRDLGARPLKILEVGAGLAWMCRAAKNMSMNRAVKGEGFPVQTVAQDVSAECQETCHWVDHYIVGEADSPQLRDLGPFDLISMTHVFEHVPYPVEFLRALTPLLKSDGIILMTMPHRPQQWDGSEEGWRRYSYNHIPAHLQYFSRESLAAVARKAGLDLTFWDASHENGEALEAHLRPVSPQATRPGEIHLLASSMLKHIDDLRSSFETSKPFHHVVIDGFFEADFAEALLRDFPAFDSKRALNEFGEVGNKAVNEHIETLGPTYERLSAFLKSSAFLDAISKITGIPDLLPDPNMFGGGTHENRHGQYLDTHVDFNYDPPTKLHRRINLLVYLNKEWDENWGGSIELHSNPRNPDLDEIVSYTPDFNRALIFETNEYSWHGFPTVNLPPEKRHLSRKSVSIYLYTRDRPENEIVAEHGTFYVQRPLPSYFQPGHVVTTENVEEIKNLLAQRDAWLAHYHRMELQVSSRMGNLQDRLREQEEQLRDQGGVKKALIRSLRFRWKRFLGRV